MDETMDKQEYEIETTKRRVTDLGWAGWAILAAIIVPAITGAFFAGSAVHSISSLETKIDYELAARDLILKSAVDSGMESHKQYEEKISDLLSLAEKLETRQDRSETKLEVLWEHVYTNRNKKPNE